MFGGEHWHHMNMIRDSKDDPIPVEMSKTSFIILVIAVLFWIGGVALYIV
jgi:hypothetical protein